MATRHLLLVALPWVGLQLPAATTDEGIIIRQQTTIPVRLSVPDLSAVATARFYVTRDRGAHWQLAHEEQVAPGTSETPVFRYQAPADGLYGFSTVTINRDGDAEPAPVDGKTIPDKGAMVVIDSTTPTIGAFDAAFLPDAAEPTLRISWTANDSHLGSAPALLQTKPTDGPWVTVRDSLPASGTTRLPVRQPAQLRLVVRDQAGNASASPPWTIPALPHKQDDPAPAAADNRLTEAIAALPTLDESNNSTATATDHPEAHSAPANEVASEEDEDSVAPPAENAPSATAAKETVDDGVATSDQSAADEAPAMPKADPPPATPQVPPDHQDVVAPLAGSWTPPPKLTIREPTQGLLPAGVDLRPGEGSPDIDSEYQQALRGEAPDSSTRYTGEATQVVTSGRAADRYRPRRAVVQARAEAAAERPAGAVTVSRATRVLASLSKGALLDAEADRALAAAREARAGGDSITALALYRRLQDSRRAAATAEAVTYLNELGRHEEAVALATSAPPEAWSDDLACAQARALLGLQRPAKAEAALRRVAVYGPEHRQAQLLRAQALRAQGKGTIAAALLRSLIDGQDEWARQARTLLEEKP